MPAAGPQPQEVAGCFTQPNEYGRYVISSGPYMIAGSDKLDADELRHDQGRRAASRASTARSTLDLVRNPAYNPAHGQPKARENFPDEFTFTVNSNADDIYAQASAAATSRKRSPARRRPSCASTRARRSCTPTTATAPGT